MKKYIRKFIKEEKRIVKLIWEKGLFPKGFKVDDLYWAYYTHGKRQRRRKRKYAFRDYLPEVHYGSCDYWGEYDEHGFIRHILDLLYWKNAQYLSHPDDASYPESTFKYQGRLWFIKYLESLPSVNRSSKINMVLRRNYNQ